MHSQMGALIERHGGVPYPAPALQEVYLKDSPEVQRLVLLTGVRTQALVQTAAAMDREEEFLRCLDQRTIIARSPKPARVLRQHKIHIDVTPRSPSLRKSWLRLFGESTCKTERCRCRPTGRPTGS